MVGVQRLLIDHLGIDRLLAVVGGSLGGHQVLAWAVRFPQRVRGAIPIATSPRLTSHSLAYDVIGRNAIVRDPHYHSGQYYDQPKGPSVGLAIARMLGHLTYLSREAMSLRFDADRLLPRKVQTEFETRFSVGSYLAHQGDKFVERFDANSYLTLSMAMDLFDLGDSPAALAQTLAAAQCRWLLVSFTSDLLFPPLQSQDLVRALITNHQPVSYCNVPSRSGHDAFLLPDDLDCYGPLIASFLANVNGNGGVAGEQESRRTGEQEKDQCGGRASAVTGAPVSHGRALLSPVAGVTDPTSIFHARRLDYDLMLELIPPGASVLDLGCGAGELLLRLKQRGHKRLTGVELDVPALLACAARGLDVVHADINDGLAMFGADHFDCVVLSQTLQAVQHVERVVDGVLTIGRLGIVSFPNFAYHKLGSFLTAEGRAPRAALMHHTWYNTPNVRFLSIADFEDFCRLKGIKTHRQVALNTESGEQVTNDPNRNADLAIFVIGR
jgi:homoserine O-acetyltransferase